MTRSKHALVCVALLLVVAAVAIGCGSKAKKAATTAAATTTRSTTSTTPVIKPVAFALPTSLVSFADFTPIALLNSDSPAYAGPATPTSLANVKVVKTLQNELQKPGVTAALEKNGFVVVPADFKLFQYAYEGNAYEGWPVFVTTDVAYHEWHLAFDKLLRSLEQQVLLPKLEQLVSGELQAAQAQTAELKGSALEDTASRVEQLYQVAAAELGQPVTLGPLAKEEKALVDAHTAPDATSPIVGSNVDYSVFTPRGHYTRTPQLTRYFVAMSVLGQLPFCVPDSYKCPGTEPARIGILASRVLDQDSNLVALWRDIYEPTAFLVGTADDYTPLEVETAAKSTLAGGLANAKAFASDAAVNAVVAALIKARPVKINPERASIRLMGTRFVLDSYLLDQLVFPNVGTETKPRLTPSALDLAASFGSGYAQKLLEKGGATAYANYSSQLKKVQKVVASRPAKDWGSTVYDAWLYALEPMFVTHGTAYPAFMRSDAWTGKALQSGFGSYTELKHDTILYSKQLIAEGGDENLYEPAPRNWVEPDPVAYSRLIEAVRLMRTGLAERNLLTKSAGNLLSSETEMLAFFKRIATDELAGRPISSKDNDRLRYIGGELEALWWRTADVSRYAKPTDADDEALIADIGSSTKGVLELGTGRIDRIYVIVPDDHGNFQLAAGGVYSYYEFLNPPGTRLSDKEWQGLLDSGKAPARPDWEKVFSAS
ncbi:MAG TPA: DUF3160 domain-containing protein [Gaiellaceae bacterium]